jgi:hypothetical protein
LLPRLDVAPKSVNLPVTGAQVEVPGECLEPNRGREARHPTELPAAGWRDIALRVWEKIGTDNASLIAAGIALNTLLAVFPALALAVSIYGLFSSPAAVAADLARSSRSCPRRRPSWFRTNCKVSSVRLT